MLSIAISCSGFDPTISNLPKVPYGKYGVPVEADPVDVGYANEVTNALPQAANWPFR